MSFLNELKNANNLTTTENGAITNKSSKSALLDYFGQGGAMRDRSASDKYRLFINAYSEDPNLALKTLFYMRDIRGGQGERDHFREILTRLAKSHPKSVRKNIKLIPEYGRWDDIYALFDTNLEKDAINVIKNQLLEDLISDNPSQCAKWLKSENASSDETERLACKTFEGLDWSPKKYRKTLSKLRKLIDDNGILETKMTDMNYDAIDYSKLPSHALFKHPKAFMRNDEKSYNEFLRQAEEGNANVNSSTLYPYQLVYNFLYGELESHKMSLYNSMWNNLPDYIGDTNDNSIAVVDTSDSMIFNSEGKPLAVALSLGLYLAQRCNSEFKNHFITFSKYPELVEITGNSLGDIISGMRQANWDGNTDLESVFDLILETAISKGMSQKELPNKLYIISDMEFDEAAGYGRTSLFNKMKAKFESNGYKLPEIVFWNVHSRSDNMPITIDDDGCMIVSGLSPSIFKNTMAGDVLSAYDLMLDVINSERYINIVA